MDFDASILKKVKERLYGAESDTQVIPSFEESILFGPSQLKRDLNEVTKIDHAKARVSQTSKKTASGKTLKTQPVVLPQLQLDLADFNKSSTQTIESDSTTLFDGQQSTQIEEGFPNAVADTQVVESYVPVTKLPKSPNRYAQTHILESEIAQTSLTDEEQDLNDAANTTVDSSIQRTVTTKAELDTIDRDLSEQKRTRNIQPKFDTASFDPVSKLLEAFQSDSEAETGLNSEKASSLSPTTSPLRNNKTQDLLLDDSDSDFEVPDALDAITNGIKSITPKKKKTPIDDYALRLKNQLLSSPTNPNKDLIVLDGSDDESSEKNIDIPSLSKDKELLVKKKYSKRIPTNQPRKKDLFTSLRRANAKQLRQMKKDDPDAELMEEIEKEEEEMGNILEREMERVRRIRKKEKQQEKAKAALLKLSKGDTDDLDKDYGSDVEVPDSDDESVMDSEEADLEDSDLEESDVDLKSKETRKALRNKRFVLSDEDEEDEEKEGEVRNKNANGLKDTIGSEAPLQSPRKVVEGRHDDSYMFGGPTSDNDNDNESDEEKVTHAFSDHARPETPPLSTIVENSFEALSSPKLFQNLPPRLEPNTSAESSFVGDSAVEPREFRSFRDLSSTQFSDINETNPPTQADDAATQVDPTQLLPESDDEEDFLSAVKRGRQSVQTNGTLTVDDKNPETKDQADSEEEDSVTEAERQELLKKKLALYEAKIRRKELKARKLRKEMERRGVKGVVEGEAEESEDEWRGIGGADNEVSDQENSEDERMINNDFNLVLNDEEVRRKFMEQYQIKDRHELEKLIDDIKNHRLTKRARSKRFDVELSDEEDEILMAYRRKKLEEQKQRLLANKKTNSLLKSEKSKAFFDLIEDDSSPCILISDEESEVEQREQSHLNSQATDIDEEQTPAKKVIRLDEAFVQKQLSFLCSTEESKYIQIQQDADYQHGATDEHIEDLATLKRRCLSNLQSFNNSTQESVVKRGSSNLTEDDDDYNDDFGRVFKKPSMVTSFKLYHEKQVGQVSTGSFSGITINKHYKLATAAKASITYISKLGVSKPTAAVKSLHTQAIEKRVDQTKQSSFLFRAGSTFT